MKDLVQERDAYMRLEQALTRMEAAAARLKQEHRRAQTRYELLDRAGSEILASLDALGGEPGVPMLQFETPLRASEPEPKQTARVTTADAA